MPDPSAVRRLVRVALLVPGVLGVAACGGPAHKDDAFIDAGVTGLLDIELTECFSDPEYSEFAGEDVVVYTPCPDGADNQSYLFVHAPDGPWDRDAVAELGWAECGKGFEQQWTSKDESGLDYYPILPTAETWADGDRAIMCAVYDPDGRLEDSVLPRADGVGS
ncbi:hypothetical protein E1262_21975 [Jiangella aurantiaca]|uniref:Septum formation-related domain-containing protein n=1 Tax=Jiangella aurantiaca TaxID=2530373 RepID=A0A4R5A3J1_9ACTN|nr:hypothetical protein [Jiangella aurantiaca]TDD66423.1 hypothetical protein E1262_21975 [Jiangella aurantiaca]